MTDLPNAPRSPEWPSPEKRDYDPKLVAELVRPELPLAYGVPPQFGMLALLSLMAAFSVTFALLRFIDAPAAVYLFLGTMAVVIGITQMRFGSVPRGASIVTGAIFLPVFWIGAAVVMAKLEGNSFPISVLVGLIVSTPFMALGGAIFGYLMGTLVAGVFLLANMWEHRTLAASTGNARKTVE